jgi:hypothetical protein
VFTVKGNTGASVTLALAAGTATPATPGTDYVNSMQHWNGATWVAYTAATPILANDELLVRVQILKDADAVSTDKFTLKATYSGTAGGVTNGGNGTGIATIVEDGTGSM